MFWADKIAKDIAEKQNAPYRVDDMFTPSGFAHIGSLRGPIVHDIVYRALCDAKLQAYSTYIFNDFDPVDGLPPELMGKCESSLGLPLRAAPSPEPGYESFAHYFTDDFQKVLRSLGVRATFLSSWDMYRAGKFNEVIRIALDHSEVIQEIYQRVSGSKKRDAGWLPLQVICESCGKLGTTRVHGWDGTLVTYTCEPSMVAWAKGCGHTGKISPFDGNGKLPWKVDWPAHWTVLGITIEGAGKDHSSAGGSRDIAKELCRDVFGIQNPYNLPYEFFLIGGKKMSSSKGLGLKGRDLTQLLPAPVGRFLFTRTDYHQAIEFDPMGTMAIPDLFDEYDRCYQAYITGSDADLSRAFELSQITELPEKIPTFLPRFRDVANFMQLPNVDMISKFNEIKGSELTRLEKELLNERISYATVWLKTYAPDEYKYQLSEATIETIQLSGAQWKFLHELAPVWEKADDPEKLQSELFILAKAQGMQLKEAFSALYTVTIGKLHGPRAGWLLKKFPKEAVIERFLLNTKKTEVKKEVHFSVLNKPEYFSIDTKVQHLYPSITVGIAKISNVSVRAVDESLENEKKLLLGNISGMTTEELGVFPEIISYRKLYKEMHIDWHSRRPSPEALLRRVVLGKGLYTVNTCVDAYNLVVMKHRISVGAFDADCVEFPTKLQYANEGDEILLLGDKGPTKYSQNELAYYDKSGGYNIDFNFRDAQRTMVTEKTKNIWINVDGVFDISPEQVERSLHESVEYIVKYCGGTVEFEGIVK